jgi:mannosyltransferase OCH1-like enzyme
MGIPPILMQTWKDRNIPLHWLPSPESVATHLPEWGYKLMTDRDNRELVATFFPDFLPYYDNFPYPIQRADAIRACFLYLYGGLYMDLDFELQAPIDHLFEEGDLFLVPSGNLSGMYTNAFMASKPRHPFWLDYIEEMKKPAPWWAIGKHLHVMTTTGPMALTRVINRGKYPHVKLPSELITPCNICNLHCPLSSTALLHQLEGGSWNGWDSRFYNWWLCNWKSVIVALLLSILAVIIGYNIL